MNQSVEVLASGRVPVSIFSSVGSVVGARELCGFCRGVMGVIHSEIDCPLRTEIRLGKCVDCKVPLADCSCKSYAAVLAANIALAQGGLPLEVASVFGLSKAFKETMAICVISQNHVGIRWPAWEEGVFFFVAGANGVRVFDLPDEAQRFKEVSGATTTKMLTSWGAGVGEALAFLKQYGGGGGEVFPSSEPPLSDREKRRRQEEKEIDTREPKRFRAEEDGILSLKDLVNLAKGSKDKNRQDAVTSRTERLRALSEGEWLAQELPLHKFFVRDEDFNEREVTVVGGLLSTRVSKKRVANAAEWLEANLAVLATCPTPAMEKDYRGYMRRASEVLKRYSFEDFRRFDEGYRRMRFEEKALWSEQFPELWLRLLHSPRGGSTEKRVRKEGGRDAGEKPCWFFNKKRGCVKKDCTFVHKCSGCKETGHSVFSCLNKSKSN